MGCIVSPWGHKESDMTEQLSLSWGCYGPSNRMDSYSMSDRMLRTSGTCHMRRPELLFLKRRSLLNKRQMVKIPQRALSLRKCHSEIKLSFSSLRHKNVYC